MESKWKRAVLKRTLELPLYILSPELWWVAGSGSQGNPTAVYGLGYPKVSEILVSNQSSNPVSSGLEGGVLSTGPWEKSPK